MRRIEFAAVIMIAVVVTAPAFGSGRLPLAPAGAFSATDEAAIVAAIDKVAQAAVAESASPGLQIAVFKNGAAVLGGRGSARLAATSTSSLA